MTQNVMSFHKILIKLAKCCWKAIETEDSPATRGFVEIKNIMPRKNHMKKL